jgi:hypothetical protein
MGVVQLQSTALPTELRRDMKMMHSVGFEPTSTNTLRPERSSLDRSDNCAINTAGFDRSEMTSTGIEPAAFGTGIRRATIAPTSQLHCSRGGSNSRPMAHKTTALTTELHELWRADQISLPVRDSNPGRPGTFGVKAGYPNHLD